MSVRDFRRHQAQRTLAAVLSLAAAAALIAVLGVSTGTAAIPPADLVATLAGQGDTRTNLILFELRLPRTVLALVVGGALGAAGALFQSMTRNPLGSPDMIGFTTGAATGALTALILLPAAALSAGTGAVLGGLAVAVAALLLGGAGQRLILIGIGLAALLTSVNAYLLTRANVTEAQNAAVWLVGSLNGRTAQLLPAFLATALLLPIAAFLARELTVLETGDDKARSLGVSPVRTRILVVLTAVGLTAAAVAAAGPISFVALAAPQLARRLTRVARPLVLTSALVGAVLLLGSDYLAQRIFAPQQLPVGAVTGFLGGIYLAVVLSVHRRRTRR